MSAATVLWAYRAPVRPAVRFTLVTLAACADTDHRVSISIEDLTSLTGWKRTACIEHLDELRTAGLVLEQHRRDTDGRQLPNRYTLLAADQQPIPLIEVLERVGRAS